MTGMGSPLRHRARASFSQLIRNSVHLKDSVPFSAPRVPFVSSQLLNFDCRTSDPNTAEQRLTSFRTARDFTRSSVLRGDSRRWISRSLEVNDEAPEKFKRNGNDEKIILYRAKWIRPIRLLVRLKLFQLGGVMALAIPLAEYSQEGTLSLGTTLAVGAVVGGAGAASTALWYYSRRMIGEMALLLPDMHIIQISVLDFWGNRENLQFDVRDVVPPLKGMTKEELKFSAQQTLIPLDVIGDRQFFLSLRHGHLDNKDILFSILNGSMELRDCMENAHT